MDPMLSLAEFNFVGLCLIQNISYTDVNVSLYGP